VVPENIHTFPMDSSYFEAPPPLQKFQFSFILSIILKLLAFETPNPLGISNDHPWGGYGCFLEPH